MSFVIPKNKPTTPVSGLVTVTTSNKAEGQTEVQIKPTDKLLEQREQLTSRQSKTFVERATTANTNQQSVLNVMMNAAKGIDFDSMRIADSERLFEAAGLAGVTPTEKKELQKIYDHFRSEWPQEVCEFWKDGLSSISRHDGCLIREGTGAAKPEDLSSKLGTIWMTDFSNRVQQFFIKDMVKAGHKHGFQVNIADSDVTDYALEDLTSLLLEKTDLSTKQLDEIVGMVEVDHQTTVWSEDNKILGDDATVLIPADCSMDTIHAAYKLIGDDGYHQYKSSKQGSTAQNNLQAGARDLATQMGRTTETTRSYIEGGNIVPGTTADGKPYALVGRDSLVISMYHLDEKGTFSDTDVQARLQEIKTEGKLDPSEVQRYAANFAEQNDAEVSDKFIGMAEESIAKLSLTADIMAEDVNIPADRLVFVEQGAFHIDMTMRPLNPGEVMINSPRKCVDLLQQALQEPNLSETDRNTLLKIMAEQEKQLETYGPIYDRVIKQVEDAGLLAIEAPGVFDWESEEGTRQANFMNAVPGTNNKGESVYMVLGSSCKPLQNAFEDFVQEQGVKHVEFFGNDVLGTDKNAKTIAEQSLLLEGGIDCRESGHSGVDHIAADLFTEYINATQAMREAAAAYEEGS